MNPAIDVVLHAGRSAVDVVLYTLLPIMVLMMTAMRALEAYGALDRIVALLTPIVRPFGLTGFGVLAMIQVSFVGVVAPIPTLALMEDRGSSDRRLATVFAAVLAMAPANALFPLAVAGLHVGTTLGLSAIGGLTAATATYWVLGRRLPDESVVINPSETHEIQRPSVLDIINTSGKEAITIVMNILPMLLLSLVVVLAMRSIGVIDSLVGILAPILARLGIDTALVFPALTKYLAGSTALVGVIHAASGQPSIAASSINASAGFLLHPLDLPAIAIFLSARERLGRFCVPAVGGACVGIAMRTLLTFVIS